jgi:hypothetical protein
MSDPTLNVWTDLEVKCPGKKCGGFAQATVSSGYEGETTGPCDECGSPVAFNYSIKISKIRFERRA